MSELFAIPYRPLEGNPAKNTIVLDAVSQHPWWFAKEGKPEDRRFTAAWLLSDPANLFWEVWRGGEFVGILCLWRISLKMDALVHFIFFDKNLVGKRTFLLRFLDYCFTTLEFERLSMEIPEPVDTLIRFARKKLGFRYEGEARQVDHPSMQAVKPVLDAIGQKTVKGQIENPAVWVARQGSRREKAHYYNGQLRDIVCLRLLKSEFYDFYGGGNHVHTPQRPTGDSTRPGADAEAADRAAPVPDGLRAESGL